uniref:Regulatory protein ArsR (NrdD) n=1 Tax=uncultured marine thaumarchaeote KM3_25_B05 TaxID=1456103 RepID=A0A075GVF1_9ARCH|nr:regulatory protein ArsR (nrdD) [uncultured marine thaumarchaeote KM3_25_B05]
MGKDEEVKFEEELDLDASGDLDDDDLEIDVDSKDGGGLLQSTSKRVRMIFSVMASPNRIDILRILNSKGPLTYSELKSLAGFKSKKESGKFAYHLRKLLRQSLVALNKSERRYTITNLGKLVLSLARQIEERSIIESGKMYVRTSHDSIEEFNSHKIIQSLVREGSLPLELSQKITEEVENRIYKFQTTYLTGSLIREMVNNVLLEHSYEEYRNKLARLGMPVFDVQEMFTNVENIQNGAEDLLFKTGQNVLTEYLLTNALPKDIADSHLSGDLHITNPGMWSLVPDIVFLDLKELIEDGLQLGGNSLGVSRILQPKTLDDLVVLLPMVFSLVTKEASQEIVIDELSSVIAKTSKNITEIEKRLIDIFRLSSTSISYSKSPTVISFRFSLSADQKIVKSILSAYKSYVQVTPVPKIGIVIDYEKGKISDISDMLSTIISLGGNVIFSKGSCTTNAIQKYEEKNIGTSIRLGSLTINLPRLAFESNKDETYFRARLALLIKPAIDSMVIRKKDISDLTRRGINPLLNGNTQFMQKNSISLNLNLVGLKEAVFSILGHKDDKEGKQILYKVVQTAVDVATKKGKESGVNVTVAMVDTDGISRFTTLDSEKYGKNSVQDSTPSGLYSQGQSIDAVKFAELTAKNEIISEYNHIAKMLTGGSLLKINFDNNTKPAEIKTVIEKAAVLTSSFKPIMHVPVCGSCSYKGEKLVDKCPICKSQFIL